MSMSVQAPTSTLVRNGWKQAIASLRNGGGWGHTLLAFTAILFLLQCLLLFALSVRGVNELLLERAGLHLEVLPGARDQEIQELYATLQSAASVSHVEYVPKEKAYEQEKRSDPELVSFLEQYKLSNPFPDSFIVTLRSTGDYADFLSLVQQEKYRTVLDPSFLTTVSGQEKDLQGVLQMTSAFQVASFSFAALAALAFCAMMLEYASRVLRARRDEFFLQEALGAARVSLSSLLASEMTVLFLLGFALSLLLSVAAAMVLPLLGGSIGAADLLFQLQSSVRPVLLTVLPAAILAEIVVFPLCAWGIASFTVRKGVIRPS